ncbi:ribonuclease H-like domain, reverse transcriptase, RNA-dependent DNA polymerase [Tanacetum coccineum]
MLTSTTPPQENWFSSLERGFLSQKGRGVGRGVKEKHDTMVVESVEDVPPIVEPVATEVQSPLMDKTNVVNTGGGSYPPLPMKGTTPPGNTHHKSSYANVIGESSRKALNIRTLYTSGGNGVDVFVPVESIRAVSDMFASSAYDFFLGKRVAYPVLANYVRNTWGNFSLVRSMFSSSTGLLSFHFSSMDGLNSMLENEDVGNIPVWVKLHGVLVTAFSEDGLSVIATKLGTPIMLDSYTADMCMQSWRRSSYTRVMIELRADVELKDTIVVAMPQINREGFYMCNVRVGYEWKPPRCACYKIFGHTQVECPKNPGLGAGAGEMKKKKSSQALKGITVGPKMAFKPNLEYRHIPKKHNANSSGNKKKGVNSTTKVSDSNPFEVLNSVDNDEEMGTNRETSNLDKNGANSSGSSFWNVKNNGTSTTPIMDKIEKFENLIIDGQAILVDEAGNPLKKAVYSGDHESEDEVASVDNDMARSLDSERTGFGTQSLSEQ